MAQSQELLRREKMKAALENLQIPLLAYKTWTQGN